MQPKVTTPAWHYITLQEGVILVGSNIIPTSTSKTPAGRHATEGHVAKIAMTGFEPGTLGVTGL